MQQDGIEQTPLDGLPAAEGLRQVIHTLVHLARPGWGGRRGGQGRAAPPLGAGGGLETWGGGTGRGGPARVGWGTDLNPRKNLRADGAGPPPGDNRSRGGLLKSAKLS